MPHLQTLDGRPLAWRDLHAANEAWCGRMTATPSSVSVLPSFVEGVQHWTEEGFFMPVSCNAGDCTKPVAARGWCRVHYARWQRHSDPLCLVRQSLTERFWSKVDRSGGPDACWPWTGATMNGGYGNFRGGYGHNVKAHRFAYELMVGPIPDGLTIDHLCRHPVCVNHAHLEPVTMRENILRGQSASALNAAKTHCHYGHPLSGANLYAPRRGGRQCRTCRAAIERRRTRIR